MEDVIFISVNQSYHDGDNDSKLYEAIRYCWKIAKKRRDENSIKYAFAIYHNSIIEVYRVYDWIPAKEMNLEYRIADDEKNADKFAFEGKIAEDIREDFIGNVVDSIGQQGFIYKNFSDLKEEFHINDLLSDIEEIIGIDIPLDTEKENLVKCRIGQGDFREKLVRYWKGCSVTDIEQIDILIASHIKPWSESDNHERLDVYNGLLLLPTLDKLFDKGYISFSNDGTILISQLLINHELLGVDKQMNISIKDEHKKYLVFHRENIFRS